MSTLAKRLREAREDRGWTKAELRRQAKLKSASTLTELEKGDLVDSPQLPVIAAALGVEVMWLQHNRGPKYRGGPTPLGQGLHVSDETQKVIRFYEALPVKLRGEFFFGIALETTKKVTDPSLRKQLLEILVS